MLGHFVNDSVVDYEQLGLSIVPPIYTLGEDYYHHWAGFENGGFLGYYQKVRSLRMPRVFFISSS